MDIFKTSVCRACRLRQSQPAAARAFSNSTRLAIIPPESPEYIDIPKSYQETLPAPRRTKGILPIPRQLFPARRPDKPGEEYLKNVTPEPKPENVVDPSKLSEYGKYKARMATMRKQHLRHGLTELYARKQQQDKTANKRSQAKQADSQRLRSQAEREDQRLTNVSTPASMRPVDSHVLAAADAKAIFEAKKANIQRIQALKDEERRDKLHTLYMNARTFITTEEQLKQAIDQEFNKQFGNEPGATSMWAVGEPDRIKKMLERAQGSSGVQLSSDVHHRYDVDQERMQKIAEKLSGGKM